MGLIIVNGLGKEPIGETSVIPVETVEVVHLSKRNFSWNECFGCDSECWIERFGGSS